MESLESLLRDEFRAPLPYVPAPVLDVLDATFRARRRRVVAMRATGCAALAAIVAVGIDDHGWAVVIGRPGGRIRCGAGGRGEIGAIRPARRRRLYRPYPWSG